jgi:tetratricopeptide (TPR) repeat protein
MLCQSSQELFKLARFLLKEKKHREAAQAYEQYLTVGNESNHRHHHQSMMVSAALRDLAKIYLALEDLSSAQRWTDRFYAQDESDDARHLAEPAYQLCRALRIRGQYVLAYHYYLVASSKAKHRHLVDAVDEQQHRTAAAAIANPYINDNDDDDATTESDIHDYLLDYEKSSLWYCVAADMMDDRRSRLHILDVCMRLLERPTLPAHLRESVMSNLQHYALRFRGNTTVLREEQAASEWRYSTPLFIDDERNITLIRAVNYNISEDGGYHAIPPGKQVDSKIVLASTGRAFTVTMEDRFAKKAANQGLHHPGVVVRGLEDSRVGIRESDGVMYTLSSSTEFSKDGRTVSQVLGLLDLRNMTHTVVGLVEGPDDDDDDDDDHDEQQQTQKHEKNWVFAGSLDNVVYEWYPNVRIGAVDKGKLRIHTEIPSPVSFDGMRGSSNGVLHHGEWWFVTHYAIYRPGMMRKYLHWLVVLDLNLTQIVRHSLPFTFGDAESSDIEYCIALAADAQGILFGYSVRDRSSWVHRAKWHEVGELFN